MNIVTMGALRNILDDVLAERRPLADLREYVFSVHEGEDVEVERSLQPIMPALEPYLLHEEASGDPRARARLGRLAEVRKTSPNPS
jgi:hypothetical protein